MEVTQTLYVHTAAAWRAWLKKHHATTREIWLVYYKKTSGKPRIPYNDAVDQALCFGWIDSRVRLAVFQARLAYFIKMTAQNRRFGMIQG